MTVTIAAGCALTNANVDVEFAVIYRYEQPIYKVSLKDSMFCAFCDLFTMLNVLDSRASHGQINQVGLHSISVLDTLPKHSYRFRKVIFKHEKSLCCNLSKSLTGKFCVVLFCK